MTRIRYLAGMVLLLALIQTPLRAEEDPGTLLRNGGGALGAVQDPSSLGAHNGGYGGYGGRAVAPYGGGSGKLQNYISQCINDRSGGNSLLIPSVAGIGGATGATGGGNLFQQTCSKCHALPSTTAAISAITNGVTGKNGQFIATMPPNNPAVGMQVLQFLRSQGAQ